MSTKHWLGLVLLLLAVLPLGAAAQETGSISGQVVDQATQQPLQGAQVTVAGTSIGTLTDQRGRFLIPGVPRGPRTVRVSLLGYRQETTEVNVGATPVNITVALTVDALRLDEVVVIGYGTERRRNVAGAVASLRPEAIEAVPITSVNAALQGRLAGVQVAQNSGVPGAAISVRVRGSSSISAGNEPLYVIDGVPLNQGDFSAIGNVSFGGQDIDALSDLNPNEIESIEILKDASAAAIYGSRASNGVVLITTKRGIAGRPEINFGGYYGVQRDWRRLDLLNADEYIDTYNEGVTARFGPASADGYDAWYGYAGRGEFETEVLPGVNTDWLSEVLRAAPMYNLDASVRGGTERARYYVAGSSITQEGTIRAMGYERLNGRLNLDYIPTNRLTLGTNIGLARSITHRARADNTIYSAWSNAMANPPIEPVFNEDGTYYETLYLNPVAMLNEAEAEERGIRILGNSFANYSVMEGVDARVSVGLDNLTLRSRTWDSPVVGPWAGNGGAAESANAFVTKLTYEGTLNFNRTVGAAHEVSGVVGSSIEENTRETSRVQGTQFPNEFFKYITSAATISEGTSTRSDWSLLSFFGRLSYTFAERVTTTFNIRTDGSSRFGTENRFGTFPSASVLWRVGDEAFMQNQNVIGNLALRASYGRTGNQQDIGNFASRGLFGGGYNYGDQPGIAPSQLANPELRWETTDQLNLGTDFSLLNDRLGFTIDYYNKNTRDLLVERPVPRTTGFSTIWSNVGALENNGLEVAARANLVQGGSQGLNWTLNVNLSGNRNEVTELYNNQPINTGFVSRVEVGYPLGYFYGYVADGIFQSYEEIQAHARQTVHSNPRRATAPGDIRFRDLNNDGVINDDDRTMIGSPWPDYEGGVTNSLSFRGLDLTAFVQFSVGNDIYNANRIYMDQYGSGGDNHTTRALRRWTPDNPNATEPRAIWGDPNRNTRDSDRFVEDGSYVRLKNLVLGYTLPAATTSRLGFRNTRIYVQGQNLLTSTSYSGFDPEVNYAGQTSVTRGTDFYTLPQTRTLTFGFNIGY
ncbi:TonB-dependent receptor [soil metagenome]|nr:TonB-dependent receptor [Gemmatimonadota bacterium]